MTEKRDNTFTEDQQQKFNLLPPTNQAEFHRKYNKQKRSVFWSYFWWFTFGLHYVYLGDWKKAILYILTGGGLGLWILNDMIFIPRRVRNKNEDIVDKVLNECQSH